MRVVLALSMASVVLLAGCATAPDADVQLFEGWYSQQALDGMNYPGLWPVLASRGDAPIVDAAANPGLVRLQIDGQQELWVSLFREGRCIARANMAGEWAQQQYRYSSRGADGVPLMTWGHNGRDVLLDLSKPGELQTSVHGTSFAMVVVDTPARDVTYRYAAVAAPAQYSAYCPPALLR